MSDIISQLGLQHNDLKWYQIAACKDFDVNLFYDKYEADQEIAKQVDQICLHCPVINYCYIEGVANKEKGTWGGVYMDLGRIDKLNNQHKTPEIWKQLRKIHGRSITVH